MPQTETALAERIAKLPSWAQDHIHKLTATNNKLEEAVRRAEEFAEAGPQNSTVFVEAADLVRPLGKDIVIKFQQGEAYFLAELQEDGGLKVDASQTLLIEPSDSYQVILRLKPRE